MRAVVGLIAAAAVAARLSATSTNAGVKHTSADARPIDTELIEEMKQALVDGRGKPDAKQRLFAPLLKRRIARLQRHLDENAQPITIQTTSGPITGQTDGIAQLFFGVPFAAPPVGDLRWKAPQPPTPWTSPVNATWFKPVCPQGSDTMAFGAGMDEDCLYLNVYAPINKTAPAGGFPVMVFYYGGSWDSGGGSFPLYDGEADVNIVQDVVYVTTNYRLNMFGFLAGDALRSESADGSVGNYGFQDQRAALKWTIANIAAVGGNPNLITIFGESAGAGSVSNHLVSPRSAGLFQRAIMESGPIAGAWMAQPYNISATRLPQLATAVNCPTSPNDAMLSCLRALDYKTLLKEEGKLTKAFLQWSPCIDGVEVVGFPRDLARAGQIAPVPVLFGSNANEGTIFDSAPWNLNASGYYDAVTQIVGPGLASQLVSLYPVGNFPKPWWGIAAMLGDGQMTCPTRETARYLNSPNRVNGPQPVYVYFYTHYLWLMQNIVDPFKEYILNESPYGVMHASELIMVFDFQIACWGTGEASLADMFVRLWTRFAATGNPNGGSDPVWTPFTAQNDMVAVLDLDANNVPSINMTSGLKAPLCDAWANITIPPSVIWGQ